MRNVKWLATLLAVWVVDLALIPALDAYSLTIVMYAGVNILLAVSLNLVNGFTGQFSMGHAGFMAVGAYTSALLSTTVGATSPAFLLAAVPAGMAVSAGVGYLVGLPSLRLKGDYLAIVTLGFGEIIRVVILNLDFLGGARGMPGIPKLTNFGILYSAVILAIFFCWRLIRSEFGREMLAVREDEVAAEATGVNTTRAKVRTFTIAAAIAGGAGALFAHTLQYLNPSIFDFNRSFEVIIMVVLGGMGSISGSVVAAVALTVLREALRPLQSVTGVDLRMIIYSSLLIGVMLTRPRGLFGTVELRDLLMSQVRKRRRA